MPIRVISFDLDDTLWPVMPTILRAEQLLFEWLQQHVPEIARHYDVDSLREHRMQVRARVPEAAHCMTQLRLAAFRDLCELHAHHDGWIDDAFEYFYRERQKVEFYEEVADVLDELKQSYRLAALSNGNADIALTGADRWLEFGIHPHHAGAAKPDPAMFRQLLQQAGIEREQLVHVGDDPYHDIQGAVEAGIRCVWVNRSGRSWEHEDFRADAEITDFRELPAVLDSLESDR